MDGKKTQVHSHALNGRRSYDRLNRTFSNLKRSLPHRVNWTNISVATNPEEESWIQVHINFTCKDVSAFHLLYPLYVSAGANRWFVGICS